MKQNGVCFSNEIQNNEYSQTVFLGNYRMLLLVALQVALHGMLVGEGLRALWTWHSHTLVDSPPVSTHVAGIGKCGITLRAAMSHLNVDGLNMGDQVFVTCKFLVAVGTFELFQLQHR
jgi:hypothetical protein